MARTVWDFLHEVASEIADINGRLAAHEARSERMFRHGQVTDVDAKNQVYRQQIGVDDKGQPVKSPWVPYAQVAGNRKIHSPPSVGQQMTLISPDGDHEQGIGLPFTWSKDQASPSQDPDTDVDQRGKCTDTQTKEGRTIEVGGLKIAMTDGKCVITADTIALVGKVLLGSEDASRELALKGSVDSAGDTEMDNLSTKVFGV
jgi:phage baseplate assembly protein V